MNPPNLRVQAMEIAHQDKDELFEPKTGCFNCEFCDTREEGIFCKKFDQITDTLTNSYEYYHSDHEVLMILNNYSICDDYVSYTKFLTMRADQLLVFLLSFLVLFIASLIVIYLVIYPIFVEYPNPDELPAIEKLILAILFIPPFLVSLLISFIWYFRRKRQKTILFADISM